MSDPTSRLTPIDPVTMRPTVDDVARLIRARTKDDEGREVGTFDDKTRPTSTQVEEHIDAAVALVGTHLPPLAQVDQVFAPAIAALVAYRAALQIEKSYYPEQVRSDRSAYEQLRQEYLDDLNALVEAIASSVTNGAGVPGHRAHSELTPTFLRVYGLSYWGEYDFPILGPAGGDYWPAAENPRNWRQPLQPPREPPLDEDVPVGDEPPKGVTLP